MPSFTVEQRYGKDWAGVFPARSREEAAAYMAANPSDDLRVTDTDGRILTYRDTGSILQPGEAAPLPSSREAKRLREHGYTEDQKREAREDHARTVEAALAALNTPAGMSAFLIARELNSGHLTAGNMALAALQAPGEIVGTRAYWKREGFRLRKGQGHGLRLTGRNFWPTPAWTLGSFGGDAPFSLPVPDRAHCEQLADSWRSWPDHSVTGLNGWLADTEPELIEGEPVESTFDKSEEAAIPF